MDDIEKRQVQLPCKTIITYAVFGKNFVIFKSENDNLSISDSDILFLQNEINQNITQITFQDFTVSKLHLQPINSISIFLSDSRVEYLEIDSEVGILRIYNCNFDYIVVSFLKANELCVTRSKINNELLIEDSEINNIFLSQIRVLNQLIIEFVRGNNFNLGLSYFGNIAIIQDIYYTDKIDIHSCTFSSVPYIRIYNKLLDQCTRNTVRLIKNSYEQQSDKISANQFHALELNKYNEELNAEISSLFRINNSYFTDSIEDNTVDAHFSKTISDWLIFTFHGITSNHSQSWVLPLYWITVLSLFCSSFIDNGINSFVGLLAFISMLFFSIHLKVYNLKEKFPLLQFGIPFFALLTAYFSINGFNGDAFFSYLENSYKLNGSDFHGLHYVVNKAFIAYLTYQFIIGVRKDVRR